MTRLRHISLIVGTLAAAASLSACGPKAAAPAAAWTAASSPAASAAAADTKATSQLVSTKSDKLGTIVADNLGFTLYRYDKDPTDPPASNCTAECASTWPPAVTTTGDVKLSGVAETLVGTITRIDGTKQLTLAGHPLYRYLQDQAPGDVNGQNVGQAWHAVTPDGQKATETTAGGATINAAKSDKLGAIVTDADGFTLYAFKKDTSHPSKSNCTGQCAQTWPPAIITTQDITVSGIDRSLVGTLTRADGSTQLTLNGYPVYGYKGDKASGDVTGQGVGGTWFVITPTGQLTTKTGPAPTASAGGY